MRVTALKLANLRAIEAAEFRFRPGFNLIVGVNGVGKTTVLDALGACLSALVKQANGLPGRVAAFTSDDVRIGADASSVECDVQIGLVEYRYLIHKPRETNAPRKKAGMPREQVHDTPGKASFLGDCPRLVTGGEPGGRPLAVRFSTNRAVPSERAPGKSAAAGGTAAAFADAFASRELRLGEFAHWMRAQEALRSENAAAGRALAAFEEAVSRFLPGYGNLRVDDNGGRWQLLIDRGDSTVAARQMSDGERGALALVLDLTRRLAQANPEMSNPVAQAEAVALIDEMDLHLHPKWQRQIVRNLTTTFPRCQFIATTHSPQIVASVEPDQVHLLAPDEIIRPDRSLGMDSNWILRHLMEADDRPEEAMAAIQSVESLVEEGTFEQAHAVISEARANGLDLPEWSILEARMARLEILAE